MIRGAVDSVGQISFPNNRPGWDCAAGGARRCPTTCKAPHPERQYLSAGQQVGSAGRARPLLQCGAQRVGRSIAELHGGLGGYREIRKRPCRRRPCAEAVDFDKKLAAERAAEEAKRPRGRTWLAPETSGCAVPQYASTASKIPTAWRNTIGPANFFVFLMDWSIFPPSANYADTTYRGHLLQ